MGICCWKTSIDRQACPVKACYKPGSEGKRAMPVKCYQVECSQCGMPAHCFRVSLSQEYWLWNSWAFCNKNDFPTMMVTYSFSSEPQQSMFLPTFCTVTLRHP